MQNGDAILGAIVGDIVGSRFEWCNLKSKDFTLLVGRGEDADECCFTDDTVMTVAIAEAILRWRKGGDKSYGALSSMAIKSMQKFGRRYPNAGYGGTFQRWLRDDHPLPYNRAIISLKTVHSSTAGAENHAVLILHVHRAVFLRQSCLPYWGHNLSSAQYSRILAYYVPTNTKEHSGHIVTIIISHSSSIEVIFAFFFISRNIPINSPLQFLPLIPSSVQNLKTIDFFFSSSSSEQFLWDEFSEIYANANYVYQSTLL